MFVEQQKGGLYARLDWYSYISVFARSPLLNMFLMHANLYIPRYNELQQEQHVMISIRSTSLESVLVVIKARN